MSSAYSKEEPAWGSINSLSMATAPTAPDQIPHFNAIQRSSLTESSNVGIKNRCQKRLQGESTADRDISPSEGPPSYRSGVDMNLHRRGSDDPNTSREHLVDTKAGINQVVAGFLTFMVIGVMSQAWGVYIPRIAQDLNASVSLVAWPGALSLALRAGAAPWAGGWSSRWGTRRIIAIGGVLVVVGTLLSTWVKAVWELYITYGILVGMGLSLIMYPSVGLVLQWYRRKKAFTLGAAMAGLGVGGFIYAPTASHMIKQVGWRVTLRGTVIGVVILLALALVLIEDLRPKQRKQSTLDLHLFREPRFTLLFMHNIFFAYSYAAPFFFTVTWAEIYGIDSTLAAFASGLVSFSNGAFKPLLGWIGDRTSRPGVFFFAMVAGALALYVYPQCRTGVSLIIINIVFGCFAGGQQFIQSAVVQDWFPSYDPARVAGLSGAGRGIGELVGPVSIGAILSFNPGLAFYVSAIMMTVSALMLLVAILWPKLPWAQPQTPAEVQRYRVVDQTTGDPNGRTGPLSELHRSLHSATSHEDMHSHSDVSEGNSEENDGEEIEMRSFSPKRQQLHTEPVKAQEYSDRPPRINFEMEPWKASRTPSPGGFAIAPHSSTAGMVSPASQ
eukprot:Clim_evm4s34 gene=Clim_evmTU4s34